MLKFSTTSLRQPPATDPMRPHWPSLSSPRCPRCGRWSPPRWCSAASLRTPQTWSSAPRRFCPHSSHRSKWSWTRSQRSRHVQVLGSAWLEQKREGCGVEGAPLITHKWYCLSMNPTQSWERWPIQQRHRVQMFKDKKWRRKWCDPPPIAGLIHMNWYECGLWKQFWRGGKVFKSVKVAGAASAVAASLISGGVSCRLPPSVFSGCRSTIETSMSRIPSLCSSAPTQVKAKSRKNPTDLGH